MLGCLVSKPKWREIRAARERKYEFNYRYDYSLPSISILGLQLERQNWGRRVEPNSRFKTRCEGWTLYSYGIAVASTWHLASEMLAT
jgi:hypothetical protein